MSEAAAEPKPRRRWYQYSLTSLFVLTLVAAIACSWFACKIREANKRKEAVAAIEELGGWVEYDYEVNFADANPFGDPADPFGPPAEPEPPKPVWLRKQFGVDFVADVITVRFPCDPFSVQSIQSPQVTDVVLRESVCRLSRLKSLDLASTAITDPGLEYLRGLTRLEKLLLWDTGLTNAGLEHISKLTTLKRLSISSTHVTDAGLSHVKVLTNLETLELNDTQVTDSGLEHLKDLTNLKSLWLIRATVTDQGVEEFQRTLPNCVIHR